MATVSSLVTLSTPPRKEIERHVEIIQKTMDTIVNHEGAEALNGSRSNKALKLGSVVNWVNSFNPNFQLEALEPVDAALSVQDMLSEVRDFVKDIIENPSAKLKTRSEQSRHKNILAMIEDHISPSSDFSI